MLLIRFQRFCEAEELVPVDRPILLAVSGGIDSMVMTHLFHRSGISIAIAHCNFGLRGEASEEDAEFTQKFAEKLDARFFLKKFDTVTYASGKGISIQMAARELRYNWFEQLRKEHDFMAIATAHHLDDQIETFLINLIRGTGLAGLHGIRARIGKIIRPMMFAYREEISEYATQHGISFREDHTNLETKYLRNKIRHEILPVVRGLNPDFPGRLTHTISIIAQYENVADSTLQQWKSEVSTTSGSKTILDIGKIRNTSQTEILLWFLLNPFGMNESQSEDLMHCLDKPAEKIFITSTHLIIKERNRIVVRPIDSSQPASEFFVGDFIRKKSVRVPLSITFSRVANSKNFKPLRDASHASLDYDKLQFPLIIRKWRPGDEFHPYGMTGMKKLGDFFIDQKLSGERKKDVWLLCSGNDIAWVVGYRIDHRFRISQSTRQVLIALVKPA